MGEALIALGAIILVIMIAIVESIWLVGLIDMGNLERIIYFVIHIVLAIILIVIGINLGG